MADPIDTLLDIARSYVDVGMATDADGYLGLIADGETVRRSREMAQMSGCGLTLRGVLTKWLRWAGLPVHSRLCAPYDSDPGAVADVIAVHPRDGVSHRAPASPWTSRHVASVDPGCFVVVGTTGADTHVYLVEAVHSDYLGLTLEAIEGGQRDRETGQQIIRRRRHVIDERGWDHPEHHADDPYQRAAKPVTWVLNTRALWVAAGGVL